MNPFQYEVATLSPVTPDDWRTIDVWLDEPQEVVGLIQGIPPKSILEWRAAQSLEKYQLRYRYQVSMFDGRQVYNPRQKGVQIIDFLVYAPLAIPLLVHGEYWHTGPMAAEDDWKESVLVAQYGRVEIAWGKDLATQDLSDATTRRMFL